MSELQPNEYDASQRAATASLARRAVAAALRGERLAVAEPQPWLAPRRGCFVTLRRRADGVLRGCIGTFEADRPLQQALIDMAGAATRDPRFVDDRVTIDELDALAIEVSVLTPRAPIADPLSMRVGVDGIYITGRRLGAAVAGCFLPDVATDYGWDAATTLSMCCAHKLGLDSDAWRPPTSLKFYTFRSMVIHE